MGTLFNVDAVTGDVTTAGAVSATSVSGGSLSAGSETITSGANFSPTISLDLTSSTVLGNGTPRYAGSLRLTTANITSAGPGGQIVGGDIILTTGQDLGFGAGNELGGGVTLTSFTPSKGGNLLLTGTGASNGTITAGGNMAIDGTTFNVNSVTNNVGIGTASPNITAALDITSTTHGFLPPRMTTVQRDAIASPATGLQIYNTTDNEPQVYDGAIWTTMGGGGGAGTVTSVDLTVPAFLSVSGNPITTSGTLAVTFSGSALPVLNGGTGTTTSTGTGSVVLSSSPTLVTPALGTPSAAVLTNATGLPLTTGVTGTLPVANGGTGSVSLTAFNVLVGNGTSAITPITPSTSGFVLTSNGTGADPAFKPSGIGNVVSIGTSGTVTADAATGNTFSTTLTGALALNGPSNPTDGQRVTFRLIQGGTPFTVTFNTGAGNFRFSTDLPSFSASGANLTDYVAVVYNSGANRWDIVSVIQGF